MPGLFYDGQELVKQVSAADAGKQLTLTFFSQCERIAQILFDVPQRDVRAARANFDRLQYRGLGENE